MKELETKPKKVKQGIPKSETYTSEPTGLIDVHKYIIGPRGQTNQEILQETGVSVELSPLDVQFDTISLRGEQAKLGPALTLVYS
ncbi:vigilin [Nephila pilipes]|uniref:Vigilin n=1 Tax=Nephila pilipes TaxID=299642 RepID=A0A8X6ME06_NEPPI|nr:vigilin [Nephila pilipes]